MLRDKVLIMFTTVTLSMIGACTPDEETTTTTTTTTGETADTSDTGTMMNSGLPLLGGYSHSVDNVSLTEVLSSDDLDVPMDLEFHPDEANEMWIGNQGDSSITIVTDMDSDNWTVTKKSDPTGLHFLASVSALAFGTDGMMATAHEEDEVTPYTGGAPGDFMGPTMWTSDKNEFDGGHLTHYDMLHNTPNGAGIAWEDDNIYWVFDGYHESLTRYDFNEDHGAGGTDHADGVVYRYVEGEVSYLPGVGSHMEYDAASKLLYVSDSGNGRIAVLDTTTGTIGSSINPNYDGSTQKMIEDASLSTFKAGAEFDLQTPSGILLHDDMIIVVDHATSIIWALDLKGNVVDWLETGIAANSLMGIDIDANGNLFVADVAANSVWRISAL